MARQILVIRGGAIGDFVLTLPALAALRNRFPQARIEILGYPKIASLALLGKLADEVSSLESPDLARFFARDSDLGSRWENFFGRFDLIISYLFDPESVFKANVQRCSDAIFIAAPHRPTSSEQGHATAFFLKPLEQFGIYDADPMPKLNFGKSRAKSGERRIAAHPGSGSPQKNWPEEKWLAFLDRVLSEMEGTCLLIGGEAEGNRLQRLAAKLPSKRLQLAQDLPLPEVAALLRGCYAFVGHDSGISHLAAALELPCLILWPQTDLNVWRPLGENVTILRGVGNLLELDTAPVLAELKSLLHDTAL